jgi:metal-dependent amidase/aminoacylase/carboxypeptidase family protein
VTRPEVTPSDAELAVVTALRAAITASTDIVVTPAKVGTKVPNPRPSVFVMVRRVGGSLTNVVQDRARIDVMVWHTNDAARMHLANKMRAALFAARGTQRIQSVSEFLGPTRLPDPADPTVAVVLFTAQVTVRAA